MPAIKVELMIANGTAVRAFVASSLIWRGESKASIVQTGARKLRINAYPFGQPFTNFEISTIELHD